MNVLVAENDQEFRDEGGTIEATKPDIRSVKRVFGRMTTRGMRSIRNGWQTNGNRGYNLPAVALSIVAFPGKIPLASSLRLFEQDEPALCATMLFVVLTLPKS